MADNTPEVVTRYLKAADAKDSAALAACFSAEGTVLDEGHTYRGHEQIIGWREHSVSRWEYTTTLLGSEPVSAEEYRVHVRVEGNFPGGTADLTYSFTIHDQLVTALTIVE
jgi:hypothetical protein